MMVQSSQADDDEAHGNIVPDVKKVRQGERAVGPAGVYKNWLISIGGDKWGYG